MNTNVMHASADFSSQQIVELLDSIGVHDDPRCFGFGLRRINDPAPRHGAIHDVDTDTVPRWWCSRLICLQSCWGANRWRRKE
jgi:hypothetical protein